MKLYIFPFAVFLVVGPATLARQQTMAPMKPVSLVPGMGALHHPVSTSSAEAQRFFDQGLSFVYAFNHDEAVRSFRRASELDPGMAMALWGIALALGPNINLDVDPEREQAAYNAVQKALALSERAPQNERAYIQALATRYSADPKADLKKLAVTYKNAMGELMKRYPDDLDAATLYAESAMDLRPWQLWDNNGKPAEGTEEILAVLESVLRRDPDHVGAIHYYVHAIEASPYPERALAFAPRLAQLMPAAGHIVHMPAHIYMRTGDYAAAAKSNEDAARADREYIRASGAMGVYPVMYYNHNLHFLAIAYSMEGRSAEALRAARELDENVAPHIREMPMLEAFSAIRPMMLVRTRQWRAILDLPLPSSDMLLSSAIFHWARGVAFVSTEEVSNAERERAEFARVQQRVPADASFGLNKASDILRIAENVLAARIRLAQGDRRAGIGLLRNAVTVEDALSYDEPPAWFLPARETLGAALLADGSAAEAEAVFRADLERNRRNGRSLFGLAASLKAQGKTYAAQLVEDEFHKAWKDADTQLRLEDF